MVRTPLVVAVQPPPPRVPPRLVFLVVARFFVNRLRLRQRVGRRIAVVVAFALAHPLVPPNVNVAAKHVQPTVPPVAPQLVPPQVVHVFLPPPFLVPLVRHPPPNPPVPTEITPKPPPRSLRRTFGFYRQFFCKIEATLSDASKSPTETNKIVVGYLPHNRRAAVKALLLRGED